MKTAKRKPKTLPLCEPWQTGDYSRSLETKIILPYQFLLLCKLWDVKPIDIITGFLNNLAHASWKREGRVIPPNKNWWNTFFFQAMAKNITVNNTSFK